MRLLRAANILLELQREGRKKERRFSKMKDSMKNKEASLQAEREPLNKRAEICIRRSNFEVANQWKVSRE